MPKSNAAFKILWSLFQALLVAGILWIVNNLNDVRERVARIEGTINYMQYQQKLQHGGNGE